jgi:hypothetical protein
MGEDMKRLTCILFVVFGCDALVVPPAPRGAPALRAAPALPPQPEPVPVSITLPPTLATDMLDMGRESVQLETKLAESKEQLAELESVIYFIDCVERRSKKKFEKAFDRGTYNEVCRTETQKLSSAEIHEAADKIIAKGKQTP